MAETVAPPAVAAPQDAIERRPDRRGRRRRIVATALGCGLLLGPLAVRPAPRLAWHASASAPIGLYLVTPARAIRAGDVVLAWLPGAARDLADRRHYLPASVPGVKHVAAMTGARVCAHGRWIWIGGRAVARRLERDSSGRSLPWWTGCRTLRKDELFLLNADSKRSFDGRYAGFSHGADVIGRARLLWAPRRSGAGQ